MDAASQAGAYFQQGEAVARYGSRAVAAEHFLQVTDADVNRIAKALQKAVR